MTQLAPTQDPDAAGAHARAVLLICCVAQFMVVLDATIVIVALPQMRLDLGLSANGQQWVVNAYTLTFAGLLMLGGRAADLFGRRRVFLVGLSVFTLCSLLGGLAQNGAWLIGARALQGLGGAILAPSTLSLLTTTFHQPDERRRALGLWSATAASGAAVGLLAGGVLTDLLDWRWVLFVNVPIGALLLIGCLRNVGEMAATGVRRHLDLPGAFTVTAGASVLVYGIVSTNAHPWGSARTIATLAVGAALIAAFLVIEARVADPVVPLGIFRRRSLSAANGVAVTVGIALFGVYFFVSLWLQQVAGFSPLGAGLAAAPSGVFTMVAALAGRHVVARIGARRQLVGGLLITAVGATWLAQLSPGSHYWAHIFVPLVLFGFGLGSSFLPMTMSGTAGVPMAQAGLASGLINTTRQLGGAVGLAALATVAAGVRVHGHSVAALHAAATSGDDRAFAVSAVVLVVGAAIALLLPAGATGAAAPAPAAAAAPAAPRPGPA